MSRILVVSTLAVLLGAAPVLAQPAPGAPVPRNITASGVTKPPSGGDRGGAPYTRASTEADMVKAQRASAARDKAWDNKMRTTMGSICKGC
ncbi:MULTISPECIES: hypothetical protein [unclassified Methylobacterium]|uniref:hypothetical protein n=1 Tax=unclassified Methylobacterium TaxID=2615210 RepID=UPI0006F828CD|nr:MULTISPECIES: hypothetical protein [unclassified Methylobacterium]KQP89348.1 hypothetical protein ASF60_19690 [Methylobacterium sp. Leaf113]KQP95447.1 hypothetical protein ASF57_20490 [Methylobacterium sp. Leaf117]MCK2056013.1 hypothetical protein [Methylobacterium sp. 37f]